MAAMTNFLRPGFLPRNDDFALLILRVWFGLTLFILHGWGKLTNFAHMSSHFPNPLHIGSTPTLLFAVLSDAVCSILVVLGLGTRWAALIIAINTAAAFFLVHKASFSGPHSGELPWLFAGWALAIFFAGPGRFSLDKG